MDSKKDFYFVTAIGVLVGLLSQLILSNFTSKFPLPALEVRIGFFIFFTLIAPLALWVASLVGKILPTLYQFAKFCAVGALNSFVDLGVFNLETYLLGREPSGFIFAAFKAVSFFAATTNSFFWNRAWTFERGKKEGAAQGIKFYAIAILGGFINIGVATLVFKSGPSSGVWLNIVSPLAGIFAALLWDFLGYKYFVFKD
jgi:putative flippase GtrA